MDTEIKLVPVQVEYFYRTEDAAGYGFDIHAVRDEERGWQASVTLHTDGFKTAEDAVCHLRNAAEHFAAQVNAMEQKR